MLLEDKVAIVTGAGSPDSIGFASAKILGGNGASVVLVDRNEETLRSAEARIPGAIGIAADVKSRTETAKVFEIVRERWGRLDILVNNAGISHPRRTIEITDDDYDQIMDVNLRGTLIMSQQALPLMSDGSSIICIASIAAQRGGGLLGGAHYAASKGGVIGLVRAMARENGAHGIRVNAVNPGVIMTRMTKEFYDDALTAKVMPQIPLARFGTPEDVAGICLFLASPLSAYVTGASIDVNGGMHMS